MFQDFKGDGFTCEDVNECNAKKAPCSKSAECVNTVGGFECQCPEGFEGNGLINGDGKKSFFLKTVWSQI